MEKPKKAGKDRLTVQGKPLNALQKTNKQTRETMKTDLISGTGAFVTDDVKVTISGVLESQHPKLFKGTTKLLFEFILSKFADSGMRCRRVDFTMDEYMESRGLKDRAEARKQLLIDLYILQNMSLEWTGPDAPRDSKTGKRSKPTRPYKHVMHLSSGFGHNTGQQIRDVYFTFNDEFLKAAQSFSVMKLPAGVLKINPHKQPNAFNFWRKMQETADMNKNKPNAGLITVKKLLEAAESIPNKKKVHEVDRHYLRKIIDPFEKAMEYLHKNCGLQWEYCNRSGEPLTEEQLNNLDNIDVFENLLIKYSFPE